MLLSIILPTHNRAALLPRAIASVLAQTYTEWELIIVDDGSTDGTAEVVKPYTKDDRIRYHYQNNRQLNGARNTGIGLARGQFAGFLDDDDELLPNHLAVMAAAIGEDGAERDIYRSGELLERGGQTTAGHNYTNGQDILPQYWTHSTGMFGMMIRTTLLREHPFDERVMLLDDFLWLNQVLPQAKFRQLDTHTVLVHLHPEQRSAHYLTDELLEQNVSRLAEAYNLPGVAASVPFSAYQQQVFHQYLHYSRQLARKGKAIKALKYWRKGLSYATTENARELVKTVGLMVVPGWRG
ncbi:MAG: glycosyltransferase family 2 protein [Bacteroidota bacterium]